MRINPIILTNNSSYKQNSKKQNVSFQAVHLNVTLEDVIKCASTRNRLPENLMLFKAQKKFKKLQTFASRDSYSDFDIHINFVHLNQGNRGNDRYPPKIQAVIFYQGRRLNAVSDDYPHGAHIDKFLNKIREICGRRNNKQ